MKLLATIASLVLGAQKIQFREEEHEISFYSIVPKGNKFFCDIFFQFEFRQKNSIFGFQKINL